MPQAICAGLILAFSLVSLVVTSRGDGRANLDFLKGRELVVSNLERANDRGIFSSDTIFNVPLEPAEVYRQIESALPSALHRRESDGSISLVLPQRSGDRVMVADTPEQAIRVSEGRVTYQGKKLVGREGKGAWSHVQITDYRHPSPFETSFRWLGEQFGI
ncbi:MAG: hypothetical protein J0H02_05180 [Armatimonadetes bacterium]|nr:hypothetical protein [Armatimonadota bacterium]